MNAAGIVSCVLIGVVLGVGAGFFMWADAADPAGTGVLPGSSPRDLSAPAAAGPTDGRTAPVGVPLEVAPYGGSVEALVDGLEVPEARRGTGTLTGQVLLEDGQPLPGVLVRITSRDTRPQPSPSRIGDGPPDRDLAARVRRYVESIRISMAREQDVVTGEDGRFAAEGLDGDSLQVLAWKEGYLVRLEPPASSITRIRPGTHVRLVATPVFTVPIVVLLPGGGQADWARIVCREPRLSRSDTWTPTQPDIRLAAGSYELWAEVGDQAEYKSGTESVVIEAGRPVPSLALVLEARTGVKGRIVVPPGFTRGRRRSIFGARSKTGQVDDDALRRSREQQIRLDPWHPDEFTALDLAPGTWTFGIGVDQGPLWVKETVEVVAGRLVDIELVIPPAVDLEGVRVAVLGPNGDPVADADVSLQLFQKGRRENHRWAERLEGGHFLVLPFSEKAGDQGTGTLLIVAQSKRFGYAEQTMPPPGVRETAIRFGEPASLRVTLSGYDGSSDHRLVRLRVAPDQSDGQPSGITYDQLVEPDGETVIPGLQPGRYRVTITLHSTLHEETIVVTKGHNAVTIPIPRLHEVTIRVLGDVVQLNITNRGTEGGRPSLQRYVQVTEGVATFGGLPAGTYTLSAYVSGGQQAMRIQVPAAAAVTFQPSIPTALVVHWRDGADYPATAGLQRNDLIVGVDGNAFDGSRSALTVVRGTLMARKECRLTVERGGRRFEVTVDTARFAEATGTGMLLQPFVR